MKYVITNIFSFYFPLAISISLIGCTHIKGIWRTGSADLITDSIQAYYHQATSATSTLFIKSIAQAKILAVDIRPQNRECLTVLQKRTLVPIILPNNFRSKFFDIKDRLSDINMHIESASSSSYSISFGAIDTKSCFNDFGQRAIRFTGEKITTTTKTAIQMYEELHKIGDPKIKPAKCSEEIEYVRLAREIEGFFIPCIMLGRASESYIVWERDGYRYSIGIKAGRLQELKEFANSAIENQP
jgi:hypothetical protein